MLISEADPRADVYVASFRQRLQELGWVEGRNVHLAASDFIEPAPTTGD